MGFFSWTTADTQESIPNIYAGKAPVTVFLLQPNGQAPIEEPEYEGSGTFGGVNAYNWLIEHNAESLEIDLTGLTPKQRYMLGVGIECGTVCREVQNGEYWHIFHDQRLLVPGHFANLKFDEVIPELGASANELRDLGHFETVRILDVIKCKYPLKFSFNKDAVYEDLPASETCPYQGYFYED